MNGHVRTAVVVLEFLGGEHDAHRDALGSWKTKSREQPGGSTAAEAPLHDTPTQTLLPIQKSTAVLYLLVFVAGPGCSRVLCIIEREQGTWCSRCCFARLSQAPEQRVSTCLCVLAGVGCSREQTQKERCGRRPAVPRCSRVRAAFFRGRTQNSPGLDCKLQAGFNLSFTSILHRRDAQQAAAQQQAAACPQRTRTHLPHTPA